MVEPMPAPVEENDKLTVPATVYDYIVNARKTLVALAAMIATLGVVLPHVGIVVGWITVAIGVLSVALTYMVRNKKLPSEK